MTRLSKTLDNEEFLPAALEILESPPSPLGRILIVTIGAFFTALVAWAWIGKADVIVSGQGKIIPTGHVKTVQPFESGVVTSIHVVDGQKVDEGQILIELDPTDTVASIDSLNEQLQDARLDLAVAHALLSSDPTSEFATPENVETSKVIAAQSQMLALYHGHQAALQEFEAEASRLRAQMNAVDIEVRKIDDSLPVLEDRLAAAGTLLTRDAMRQDDRLSLEQSLIEMRAARDGHQQSRLQLEAAILAAQAQKEQSQSGFVATHRAAERDARGRIQDMESQITTEARRNQYRSLVAPVSGFVDQLTVHTVGGVLNAGEPVMNIVPSDSQQEIEAFILNKDIGFVSIGDTAEIKLEAFPFTRYGVLDGTVTAVSNDAIAHDQFGLVYKVSARITTPPDSLEDSGIAVGPGMNVTLEVLTEQRRIIDYFISPLLRYKDEAIRER